MFAHCFRRVGKFHQFKNLPTGKVRYYPLQEETDTVRIDTATVRADGNKVLYDAELLDKDGNLKQRYGVSFRVKFKDGKDKPVRVSEDGAPANLAATIALKLYGRD